MSAVREAPNRDALSDIESSAPVATGRSGEEAMSSSQHTPVFRFGNELSDRCLFGKLPAWWKGMREHRGSIPIFRRSV
jgi:hypothetical protein